MPRGGRRPGAGRKLGGKNKPRIQLKTRVDIASPVLDEVDQIAVWKRLVHHKHARVSLAAMEYLTDRVHGRPIQMVAGDLQRPISINLTWGTTPQWAEPVNVTPVTNLLSIPLESLITDSSEKPNE